MLDMDKQIKGNKEGEKEREGRYSRREGEKRDIGKVGGRK